MAHTTASYSGTQIHASNHPQDSPEAVHHILSSWNCNIFKEDLGSVGGVVAKLFNLLSNSNLLLEERNGWPVCLANEHSKYKHYTGDLESDKRKNVLTDSCFELFGPRQCGVAHGIYMY